MDEYKIAMLELLKYQHQNQLEQQKYQHQNQLEQQKLMDEKLFRLHEKIEQQQIKFQQKLEELTMELHKKSLEQQERFERMIIQNQQDQMSLLEMLNAKRYISVRKDSKDKKQSGVAQNKKVQNKNRSPKKLKKTETHAKKLPPNPCAGCGQLHWNKDCPYRFRDCQKCKKWGHKTTHYRAKKDLKTPVKITKTEQPEVSNIRKCVRTKRLDRTVKPQSDSGSDLANSNKHTRCRLKKQKIIINKEVTKGLVGEKIKFKRRRKPSRAEYKEHCIKQIQPSQTGTDVFQQKERINESIRTKSKKGGVVVNYLNYNNETFHLYFKPRWTSNRGRDLLGVSATSTMYHL